MAIQTENNLTEFDLGDDSGWGTNNSSQLSEREKQTGANVTFTDCHLRDLTFYNINSVEIIISPLHRRIFRKIRDFFLGGIDTYT